MTADLSALIARLEAAEAKDAWVHAPDVHLALFGSSLSKAAKCPPYTTSLDAALALAERVCPDHHSSVGNLPVSDDADYEEHHHFGALLYSRYTKPYDALGHGATRALALCIATLRAKLDGYEVNKNPKAQEG